MGFPRCGVYPFAAVAVIFAVVTGFPSIFRTPCFRNTPSIKPFILSPSLFVRSTTSSVNTTITTKDVNNRPRIPLKHPLLPHHTTHRPSQLLIPNKGRPLPPLAPSTAVSVSIPQTNSNPRKRESNPAIPLPPSYARREHLHTTARLHCAEHRDPAEARGAIRRGMREVCRSV